MKFLLSLAVAGLILSPAQALDKVWMVKHLRKSFNIDPLVSIDVGDPKPSKLGDLLELPVTFDGKQTQIVFLTKDEKTYFWGMVLDLTVDPDVARWSKIDFKGAHARGSDKAPVTVVEFSDLQCPHCQKGHEMIKEQLRKDYPDSKVRVVFKQYPLQMHDWAERASVAAECAGNQSEPAFWSFVDNIFTKAKDIKSETIDSTVKDLAVQFKLDKTKFNSCYDKKETLPKVQANKMEGSVIGVNSTPSYLVNGRLVRGDNYTDLKTVIEEKLSEAKK